MFYSSLVKLPSTLPLAVEHVFAAFWMSAHAGQACAYYSAASSRWINTCWKYYKQDICIWPKSLTSAPPYKQVTPKTSFNDPGLKHLHDMVYFPILVTDLTCNFKCSHKYAQVTFLIWKLKQLLNLYINMAPDTAGSIGNPLKILIITDKN